MPRIPIKDAVRHAKESLIDLYQDDPPKELALEEIELVKQGDCDLWSVTLGFHRPQNVSTVNHGTAANFFGVTHFPLTSNQIENRIENRIYKKIFIDASTGNFVKMDMRHVQ